MHTPAFASRVTEIGKCSIAGALLSVLVADLDVHLVLVILDHGDLGNLQEGELEIGQVASLFREMQTVSEVMKEIMEDFRKGMEKIQLAL